MPRTATLQADTILNIKKQNVENMLIGAANRQRGIGKPIPITMYVPMITMVDDSQNFNLLTQFQLDRLIDKLIITV